jgi:hypothetical protein
MEQPPRNDSVTVRLSHGEKIALSLADAELVFDELWLLSSRMKGAITAAAKLKFVKTWSLLHGPEVLTEPESDAFREALQRVEGRAGAALSTPRRAS